LIYHELESQRDTLATQHYHTTDLHGKGGSTTLSHKRPESITATLAYPWVFRFDEPVIDVADTSRAGIGVRNLGWEDRSEGLGWKADAHKNADVRPYLSLAASDAGTKLNTRDFGMQLAIPVELKASDDHSRPSFSGNTVWYYMFIRMLYQEPFIR
jgi:hypothetical protein